MRQMWDKLLYSRLLVLVWVSLWMLAVPLVHIHPEADHRHGDSSHDHGSTVHTVFSPDLIGEFSVHDHSSVADKESRCPLHLVAQPSHGAEHFEIDVLLASSAAPQIGKGTALDLAAHSFHANPPVRTYAAWQPQPRPSLTNRFLTASLSSRAPPPTV
jgi:hypothetical protein